MKSFPPEFADLLSPKGRRILEKGSNALLQIFNGEGTPLALLGGMISPERAMACRELLDHTLYQHLRHVDSPIPPEAITGMTQNYQERLPKAVRIKTAIFESKRSASYRAAESVGLIRMMNSESFQGFAEAVTGYQLWPGSGKQAILYEHGDYSGPHNDHHPELEEARDGYIDLHITFGNSAVAHHMLVYEENGHLSRMENVAVPGGIAVYRLPFWHYTTPLVGKPKRINEARRWLLLGSFNIVWEED